MTNETSTRQTKLRTLGFSLLLIGMSLGGLARSLRISDSVALAMNAASIASSLGALALFMKARPSRRANIIVMVVAALVVAALVVAIVVALHR